MGRLHVLMRKEDVIPERLAGKAVVVIDVVFATSTIVTAFQHGAAEVVPAAGPDAARDAAAGWAPDQVVLAGEYNMQRIPGFASYAPLALSREPLAGRRLIYSTTNGTVALWAVRHAERVYAGTLLNGAAVAEDIRRCCRERTVLLVCAGSGGGFNLEDFFGAGYIVDQLLGGGTGDWDVSDAALAARAVYQRHADDPLECLAAAKLGRMLMGSGGESELRYAARPGAFDVVPVMVDERLLPADA